MFETSLLLQVLKNMSQRMLGQLLVHPRQIAVAVVAAMLQLRSMVPMIVLRYGHYVVFVTLHWLKHGMAEHLSVLIMQSARLLLSGLVTLSGLRKCGKANSTEWLPI